MFGIQNSAAVSTMACDLRMAQVDAQLSRVTATTTKALEKSLNMTNLQQIAQNAVKLDQLRGGSNAVHKLMAPDEVNVDQILEELFSQQP
jgi:hypothetical protein